MLNKQHVPIIRPRWQQRCILLCNIYGKQRCCKKHTSREDVASGTAKGVGKENIAEINGYKSYYGQKAKAPNTGNSKHNKNIRLEI